jgi:cytochrome c
MAVWYRISRLSFVAAAVMVTAVTPVRQGTEAAGAADMELGRYLASECMTCHRAATETSTIPNIFGLTELHVAEVMKAYRDKALPNPVMQNIASRLTDEEIAALALYFAKTKKP